jgi:hypothetical protein
MKRGHHPECCKYNRVERHKECTEETCENCYGCREHAVFVNATRRKMENGERQKLIRMFADASQVRAFNIVWRTWLNRWSKEEAMDRLIGSLCDSEARYQDLVTLVAERKKKRGKK